MFGYNIYANKIKPNFWSKGQQYVWVINLGCIFLQKYLLIFQCKCGPP